MKKLITIRLCLFFFVLCFTQTLFAQPANDNVCDALTVVLDGSAIVVDNAAATIEANENSIVPPSSSNCIPGTWCDQSGPDGGAGFDNSVWFKFIAPASTAVLIDICGSSFDSQLALYEATDCADFSTFTFIWATDDKMGCGSFVDENGDTQSDLSSDIRIECLEAGKEYFLVVDAWQNATRDADILGDIIMVITTQQPVSPGVTISNNPIITDPRCPGGDDGAIDITLINGVEPIRYEWSNGETTQDISGLTAGTYTVTITDFCQKTEQASFDIEDPATFPDVVLADNNLDVVQLTNCGDYAYGGQLTATVSSGIAPYQYAWSNGATDPHIDSLADGSYTLTVTDACGIKTAEKTYHIGATAGPDKECVNDHYKVMIGVDNSTAGGTANALTYTDLDIDNLNILLRCANPDGFIASSTYWQAYDLQVDFGIEEEVTVTGMEVFFFARGGEETLNGMIQMEFRLYINASTDLSDTSGLILVDEVITQMPRMDFDSPSYIVPFKPSKFGPGDIVVIEAAYVGESADLVQIYHLGVRDQVTVQPSYWSSSCGCCTTPIEMNTGPLAGINLNFANSLILAGEGNKLSYAWDNSSGGLSADNIATPLATNGTYALTITDTECGNSITDEVTVSGCWTVGTRNLEAATFTISPNPSKGSFQILNEGDSRHIAIRVFDLQGKLVHTTQLTFGQVKTRGLNLEHLSKGIYLAQLTGEKAVENYKLIIQ